MKAVDTNLVLRILTGDDAHQARVAAEAISDGVFVSSGVLLEAVWVLRSGYGWDSLRIIAGLRRLLSEQRVEVSDPAGLGWALDRFAAGADWADMIHLVDASGHEGFMTFDRRLPAQAGPDLPVPIQVLQ